MWLNECWHGTVLFTWNRRHLHESVSGGMLTWCPLVWRLVTAAFCWTSQFSLNRQTVTIRILSWYSLQCCDFSHTNTIMISKWLMLKWSRISTLLYYSTFAKDHAMFVMEQSWNGSHPETHWKHETPLPGWDCIMWVTHKLLTIVAGNWTVWDIFMTWSNILKPPLFGGLGKTSIFGGLLLLWQNACYLLFTFGM